MNEVINCWLRNAIKFEFFEPLLEILDFSNFFLNSLRINKFDNKLLHFVHIYLSNESLRSQMIWFELSKLELFMGMSAHHFSNWYFFRKLSYGLEELRLICSFEVFELLSIMESNEIWNGIYLESTWCISHFLSVASCEDQIWIFVGFGCALKCRFDPHAWWAGWAPEVND